MDEPLNPPANAIDLTVQVRFGDTDPYGVVYFASYFRYCHRGIEEFLRHNGLPPHQVFKNEEEGFGLPIAHAECKFLRPVRYGEALCLKVYIVRIKEKSITFGFQFRRQDREEIVASGQATMVAIGRDWHARPVPERVLQAFEPGSVPQELNTDRSHQL